MLLSILNIHENLKQKKGSVNSIHKDAINKSTEQRLNLRRSQLKGYSTFYNTPFLFKSSAQDLSPKILDFSQDSTSLVFPQIGALRRRKTEAFYTCSPKIIQRQLSLLSSTDSDLEAFSHNRTDGSFAPLPFQASASANCLNLRFLSY